MNANSRAAIQLEEIGFACVVYPDDLREAVLTAINSWRSFCLLPKEVKQKFAYLEGLWGSGAGFEIKEKAGSSLDLKENFHVTINQLERLEAIAREVEIPQATQFIMDAEKLIELAHSIIINFARSLEDVFSLGGLHDEVLLGKNGWVLRYLYYFEGQRVGDEAAASHVDKSGFTLHLFENHRGLEYLSRDRLWNRTVVPDGSMVIVPGMQLQFRSKNELNALCHRVIATEAASLEGRYSMVCFVPFVETAFYSKGDRGRLQEFEAGFNYDMPFTEFSDLFG